MSTYDDRPDTGRDAPLSRDPGATATMHSPQPSGQHMTGPGPMYGYGQWEMRPRRIYPIETKPFFLTSEFFASLAAVLGIAITAASSDSFGAWRAWILITAITVGYLVSRGISKSGTRSHADDFREHLDWGRGNQSHDGR